MKRTPTIIAAVTLWLCPFGFATTKTTVTSTSATIQFGISATDTSVIISVSKVTPPGCDLSCTYVNYSFCVIENPGCLEGFTEVPASAFKGNVGTGFGTANTLTLTATMFPAICTAQAGIAMPGIRTVTVPMIRKL
jgi:hypothetical protein